MEVNLNISDLEKDYDIPLPGSRKMLDMESFYRNRPPPSLGNKKRNVKPDNHRSNHASDALENITWYSSQIKDCPDSSLRDTVKETDTVSVLPLLTAYDQRLALAEKAVKSMNKKLDSLKRKESECNQQLVKSQLELETAHNESKGLKDHSDQSEELKWYKEENTFLASQVFEMIEKFEQGSKFNNELQRECGLLNRKLENSESKFHSLLEDYERAVRWITLRKDTVKDYENCINAYGLEYILDLTDQRGSILSTKVALTMKEASGMWIRLKIDLKQKLTESNQKFQSLNDENAFLITRFLFEMEKKKTELEVLQTRVAELSHLIDRSENDKKFAENEALKASKSNIYMEDHYKSLIRERDDQICDIILKSKNELKITRDQFSAEKSRLNFEIDELKKSKVELQTQIGNLMRDKRKVEFDLETVHRNNEIYRKNVIV